jgi:catechol 2,3-dioxygenase-like lactoylglutathione lyase family enzyme
VDWTLEVVIVPVSDLDASIACYRDQAGFELDHDTQNEHLHIAQLTPRGRFGDEIQPRDKTDRAGGQFWRL